MHRAYRVSMMMGLRIAVLIVVATTAFGLRPLDAIAQSSAPGSLLGGYAGPGGGDQVILGQTFINPPGGGGNGTAGGSGGSVPVSAADLVAKSPGSASAAVGATSAGAGGARVRHRAGGVGAPAAPSPAAPASSPAAPVSNAAANWPIGISDLPLLLVLLAVGATYLLVLRVARSRAREQ